VKDARGNVLPNILIEVKDNDENPVRAFKTNQLGQFASATPLLNGTYTILFEDPAKTHNFDAIQIEVTGEIMQPVEVISHDQREDFGLSFERSCSQAEEVGGNQGSDPADPRGDKAGN